MTGARSQVAVTGATGQLGNHVVTGLLRRGAAPAEIVATGRSAEKLDALAEQGVRVVEVEYDDPDSLDRAFANASKLLFISGSEIGQRGRQHENVVRSARAAGVGHIAYTSILHADRSSLRLATEHRTTEEMIRASGVPFTFLRNGWYLENYTGQLANTIANGIILGCAGQGRISAAARRDYAEAAVEAVTGIGHAGMVYELGGDDSFTLTELAAEITRQSGREVVYGDLSEPEYRDALIGFGLPEGAAAGYADGDRGVGQGELFVDTHDLSRLIGRPTTTLAASLAAVLRAR